jgi:hypothetical protein
MRSLLLLRAASYEEPIPSRRSQYRTTLFEMSVTALAQKLRMNPGTPSHHRGLAEWAGSRSFHKQLFGEGHDHI